MRTEATETDHGSPDGSEAALEERVFSMFPIFRELKQIAAGVPDEDWSELTEVRVFVDSLLWIAMARPNWPNLSLPRFEARFDKGYKGFTVLLDR
jgi:hypothetical protein